MIELYNQILEIESLYHKADAETQNIVWESHHPDYSESLIEMMSFIAGSNWVIGNYTEHLVSDVIANIDNANINQVKCAITALNRSENWQTGAWIQIMKKGSLESLIKRGKLLTKPLPFFRRLLNAILTKQT